MKKQHGRWSINVFVIGASRGFYSPSTPTISIPVPCHLFHQWIYTYYLCTYWVPGNVRRPREGHSIGTEQFSSARPRPTPQYLLTAPVSPNQSLTAPGIVSGAGEQWEGRTDPLPVLWSSRTSKTTDKHVATNPELIIRQAEQWSRGQRASARRQA